MLAVIICVLLCMPAHVASVQSLFQRIHLIDYMTQYLDDNRIKRSRDTCLRLSLSVFWWWDVASKSCSVPVAIVWAGASQGPGCSGDVLRGGLHCQGLQIQRPQSARWLHNICMYIIYVYVYILTYLILYRSKNYIKDIHMCVYIYNDHIGTTESRGHIECSRHTPHVRGGTKPAYSEQPH